MKIFFILMTLLSWNSFAFTYDARLKELPRDLLIVDTYCAYMKYFSKSIDSVDYKEACGKKNMNLIGYLTQLKVVKDNTQQLNSLWDQVAIHDIEESLEISLRVASLNGTIELRKIDKLYADIHRGDYSGDHYMLLPARACGPTLRDSESLEIVGNCGVSYIDEGIEIGEIRADKVYQNIEISDSYFIFGRKVSAPKLRKKVHNYYK